MLSNLIKKLFVIFTWSVILFSSSLAWYYSFSHSPISNLDIYDKELKNWKKAYIYKWNSSIDLNKVLLSDISFLFNQLWYFKFFKYSHFWRAGSFDQLNNGEIDLSDLAWEKLDYPVVWAFIWDYVILLFHKNLLTEDQQDLIWRYYNYDDVEIEKYRNNWYKTKVRVEDTYFYTYDFQKYFKMLSDLNKSLWVINFQVGQNPLDKYDIDDFSDDLLQVEVLIWNKVRGILLSMSQRNDENYMTSNASIYWKEYQKDIELMDNLMWLYDSVRYFYNITWKLPEDLGSMQPSFIDITTLNPHSHQVDYTRVNKTCFKVWFKPFSAAFRKTYSSQMNKTWYWYSNFCVE